MFRLGSVLVRRTGCFRKRVTVSEYENIPDAVTPERETAYCYIVRTVLSRSTTFTVAINSRIGNTVITLEIHTVYHSITSKLQNLHM